MVDNVALGFSRLSIIGLSNGMQPIYNEDESLVLICNGEIFNYIELKQELLQKGHHFRTNSDVEVILHLYEEYGYDFINSLNGQFAFAIYDRQKNKMFCARDQMGIVPFYYTLVNQNFIFASEIKAILEHPEVKVEVDMVGMDQVLTFAGLISPRTMFKDVHSLQNGHFVEVGPREGIVQREYWDLIYPMGEVEMNGLPETYYTEKLEVLIENAIKLRLRADVPYGMYLSGGLDSSIITMKVNQIDPYKVHQVFSIDFVDSQLSETVYQNAITERSKAKMNRKTFFYEDISDRLRSVIYHCECPIKESYNTASLSLSKAVRDKNIKVILSGEGADELFAGYVGYRFDKMRNLKLIETKLDQNEAQLRKLVWGDENFFYEKNLFEFGQTKKNLYSEQLRKSYSEINCLNFFVVNKERLAGRSTMNKRAYLDYKLRLVDHLVSDHGDRMALANSVEVRYPFLDKNFAEFSTEVPHSLKLNEFTEKYILKKMAAGFVPKKVIEREKFGFVAPGSPYLLQNKVEYIEDILSFDRIKRQGYFDPRSIESLKSRYQKPGYQINMPFESDLLMPIITFGILLETFFEN